MFPYRNKAIFMIFIAVYCPKRVLNSGGCCYRKRWFFVIFLQICLFSPFASSGGSKFKLKRKNRSFQLINWQKNARAGRTFYKKLVNKLVFCCWKCQKKKFFVLCFIWELLCVIEVFVQIQIEASGISMKNICFFAYVLGLKRPKFAVG